MSPQDDQESAGDQAFERQARADLRRAVADTSPDVRLRLDAMVAVAVRETTSQPARSAWRVALPVGGSVAAAVLAALMLGREPPAPHDKPSARADDLALLLNVDNLDLLEQMEFYLWLDREPGVLQDVAAAPLDGQRS
jgi:cysteine synthase